MGAVKKAYVSWEDIELDVEKIVAQVSDVDYVVGIPRGGLIIAVMISHRLDIKHMTIDHLEKLEEFGLDIDIQNVPAAEVLSTTTGALVLEGLSNFKGAISDGERKFVKDINAGLNMSKAGIAANIALQKKGNEITLKYNEEANDWVERNGGLSKKDKLTGESWSQFTTKFHKENPLISNEERKNLSQLSKNYDQDFLDGNNVQTVDGIRIVEIGGKLYKLD